MKILFSIIMAITFLFTVLRAEWIDCQGPYDGKVELIKIVDNGLYFCVTPSLYATFNEGLTYGVNNFRVGNDTTIIRDIAKSDGDWERQRFYYATNAGLYERQGIDVRNISYPDYYRYPWDCYKITGTSHFLILSAEGIFSYNRYDEYEMRHVYEINAFNYIRIGTEIFAATRNGIYKMIGDDKWDIIKFDKSFIVNDFKYCGTKVIAGTSEGLYYSNDSCKSWHFEETLGKTNVNVLYYNESRIYAGTSVGFFSFDDNLENITNLSANLTFLDVLSMVISKNKIFIGTNGAGAYYRELDETEWKNTGDFTNINRLRHFNNLMYSCNRSGLHISNDSGLKWQIYSFIGHDVKDYYQLNDVSFALFSEGVYRKNQKDDEWSIILRSADLESKIKFTCLTGNNYKLYLGTNMGLYSSDNLGESWIKVSKDINILNTIIDQDEIFVIASDGLYKANIQSDSFSLSKTFSSSWIKSVASHRNNVYLSNGTRLYKSSDRGVTWDEITKSDVVGYYDISITENCIFVGSNYGKILLSYDNGNNWHIDSSLANDKYHTSFTYGYENYIFTSYKYQGQIKHLRRAELSSIVSGIKENSPLHQPFSIHPNPATEFITITKPSEGFEPSEGSDVKIYNTLGECVLTEPIHPMTPSHPMNVGHLPLGVYYLRIGNQTQMFVKV